MSEVTDYWKPQLAKADDTIHRLSGVIAGQKAVLQSARSALIECANIIRPTLPSFSDNVIGAHLNEINGVIGVPDRGGDGQSPDKDHK